jgi:S-adenosylmethionine-diacylglycerol 3-amino-3-carboxypropyl transferase
MKPADPWTHEAARLPIAFAQVREDPQVDAALLSEFGGRARVLMIASGGDTAALLAAAEQASHLHLIDVNPAQLALTQIKLHLLRHASPSDRAALLGHRRMSPGERTMALAAAFAELRLADNVFGPPELVARLGPDQSGRYEILFAHLRACLAKHQDDVSALLDMDDPAAQAARLAFGAPLGATLDAAFDSAMRLENLVALFGAEATRNPLQDFSRHFAERTRRAFGMFPARTNSFLAQLLLDPPTDAGFPDWMLKNAPARWPEIVCTRSTMMDALRALPEAEADFVHLSNILDWLSPEAAGETLALTWRALRPGGLTVVRQLNSSLEIPPLGGCFDWQHELAAELHREDRSFFYRALHVGRKPGP